MNSCDECEIRLSEGEARENEAETISEELMARTFSYG